MFDSSEPDTQASKNAMLLMSAIAVLALIAFVISAYLTWTTWQSSAVLGCTGDSTADCDSVLSSQWSKWLGLPVSLFGMLTYGAILALVWPAAKHPLGWASTCQLALSQLAVAAAIWFVMVQIVFLDSYCPYCMGVHACGTIIAVLTQFQIRCVPSEIDYDQMGTLLGVRKVEAKPTQVTDARKSARYHSLIAAGVASVGVAFLMGGQLLFAPQTLVIETDDEPVATALEEKEEPEKLTFTPSTEDSTDSEESESSDPPTLPVTEVSSRFVSVKGLRGPINIFMYPMIGNPDAPHVFLEMLDYTCEHCRLMHKFVQASLERYGDQVVFVLHHVPLSKRCNPHIEKDKPGKSNSCEYARLAISMSKMAPNKFREYHDWLMESEKPPSIVDARKKAMRLAGDEILLDKEIRIEVAQELLLHCDTFHASKAGLPLILTERGVINGLPTDQQQWFDALEQNFGLKPLNQALSSPTEQ